MAQTEEGINECKRIDELDIKGYSLATDLLFEEWDKLYGIGPLGFSVYVLTDSTRPIKINFGQFLRFYHEPFYVGYGIFDKRVKASMGVGRQQDKYTFKTARINRIKARGGIGREVIIGHFYTQKKAHLVERKIMNIPYIRSFLENGEYNYCEIPLIAADCNVIYTPPTITAAPLIII
jgi:hypothetical protein